MFETTYHTGPARGVLPNDGYGCSSRRGIRGAFRFGPRYDEGTIAVTRTAPGANADDVGAGRTKEFSLYYRVYNPSSLRSEDSPPLVVVHGGP